ncbi:MAG: Smr/MutS family protein [Pseudomonadota bacterium]
MPGDGDKKNRETFREAMAGVKRLHHDGPEPFRRKPAPRPRPKAEETESGDDLADQDLETPEFLEFRRPGIQKRLFQDLRRGVLEPTATLDLHGLRVVEARDALVRFLGQSTRARRRCVRIIHGKGYGSDHRQPVLKQKVNQWLLQRQEVLAFCSAPRWDGGTGAVYVLLARRWE